MDIALTVDNVDKVKSDVQDVITNETQQPSQVNIILFFLFIVTNFTQFWDWITLFLSYSAQYKVIDIIYPYKHSWL